MDNARNCLTLAGALDVLAGLRSDQVVITTMSAARQWMRISKHPLDFHYVPSTMGGGLSLALGLAIARPDREVMVLTGDGCLLMNLGSLVTVAVSRQQNVSVIVIDNGVYETTGGQKLITTNHPIDLADMARAARFPNVAQFNDLTAWTSGAAAALGQTGPRFILLKVAPMVGDFALHAPSPMGERIAAFRAALNR